MARKQSPIRKRSEQKDQIDNIAKYSSQPRSLAPKRPRTDFANLIWFYPSSISGGSSPGLLSDKDELSSVTTTGVEDSKKKANQLPKFPLVRCSKAESKEFGVSPSSIEVPVVEAEPVTQDAISDPHSDRNIMGQKSDVVSVLELTPKRSQITESCSASVSPGCVMWCPAETLQGKEHTSSCMELFTNHEGCGQSSKQDHSSAVRTSSVSSSEVLETWRKKRGQKSKGASSASSKPSDNVHEARRGKRERKPKVHFDEAKCPSKSKSEPRRLRMMRYLGLAPPVGSPF